MTTVFLRDGRQRRVARRLLGRKLTRKNQAIVSGPDEAAWLLSQLDQRARPGTENYRGADQEEDARVIPNPWTRPIPERNLRRRFRW